MIGLLGGCLTPGAGEIARFDVLFEPARTFEEERAARGAELPCHVENQGGNDRHGHNRSQHEVLQLVRARRLDPFARIAVDFATSAREYSPELVDHVAQIVEAPVSGLGFPQQDHAGVIGNPGVQVFF